jgi:tRNA pseudouridine38-40 synthase
VHAVGQVAHIDLEKPCDAQTVCDAINFHLRPHAIAVLKAAPVPSDFHARFSAIRRIYCYTILMSRHVQPSIGSRYMWHVWRNLDLDAMREAAAHLLGAHDFTSFRAAHCQAKSPLRTLDRLEFIEKEDPFSFGRRIEVWVEARSFLHRQVRNMTGTLKLVGEGRWKPDDVRRALEAKDRCAAGPAAPASGLCFMRADYPDLEPGTASTHPPAR